MDDVLNFPGATTFNFYGSFSLQKLASTKLASRLWRDKILKHTENQLGKIRSDPSSHIRWLWNTSCLDGSEEFSCREVIVVPTRIGDLIDERIVLIGDVLRIWLEKLTILYSDVFWLRRSPSEKIVEIFWAFLDNIVLKKDCTICIRSTVMRVLMLTELEIDPKAKYKMACEFCLENCVREFWPSANNNVGTANTMLGRSELVLYWNDVMMNSISQESDNNGLRSSLRNKNWAAVEYFWDKLSRNKQTLRAIDFAQNTDFDVLKFLLPKLNQIQAEIVCEKVGDCILSKMVEKEEYFEYAMKSWMYMKDFIPVHVFHSILRQLCLIVFNHSESNLELINRSGGLLHEIWITAPDQLRASVLNRDIFDKYFALLDDHVRGVDNYDLKFIFELLANANYELRHTVWLEHWRKLIIRAGPMQLEELTRLCLANEEEIEQFKEQRMANFEELESYFSSCIEKKFISELCQYLNFCVKNPRRLENLSKEIILSNLHPILSCDDEDELAKIHSLIHCTFRDSQSANKFTKELISAPEFLGFIYCKLDEGRFDKVISTADRFPTYQKNLNEMKREFLDYCSRNLARGQITEFDRQKFEHFLCWCSLNETTISKFRQSLIIDDIFEIIVNKLIQEGLSDAFANQTLHVFNEFLEWYFGNSENAKIYKSSKMFHYKESEPLKIAFQRGGSYFVDLFLKWAFNDDAEEIDNVKQHWSSGSS